MSGLQCFSFLRCMWWDILFFDYYLYICVFGLLCMLYVRVVLFVFLFSCFFFFKQKKAYEMRISDWSSDVCSSDLDALELARHDFAHVLAEAVQALFPGTQITFGPATADGFYYDFAPTADHGPFRDDELPLIEAEMRRIIAADKVLRRGVGDRDALSARWQKDGESFKAEWAAELPAGEEISVYWSGDADDPTAWMDMCRGPHLASTGKLDLAAFKLTRVSGAYWRGDQKNAQLSRIYGTGWLNRKQLADHPVRLEEAAKRDHRRLGQDMDLFHLQAEAHRSEEHTSELQSLMRISYAVFCLKNKQQLKQTTPTET